ncbi:MAG: phage tail sheath family protein, partial [Fibrobacter sp.]|nr:phage tail sheath family protein [Fibrobacter sp.]
ECASVQNELLKHCNDMQNRFAILDVFDGYKEPLECINAFREGVTSFLKYGAAYYPWIHTNIVSPNEVSFANIDPADDAYAKLALDLAQSVVPTLKTLDDDVSNLSKREAELVSFFKKLSKFDAAQDDPTDLHNTLKVVCPKYAAMMNNMSEMLNLMAPSAAMAGIYTRVDNNEGVWKAPANVGVNAVVSPAVNLTNDEQEDLNVPLNGKAVNAIRYFVGDGIKVWGARTLDGNSLDWRYVNVRRTMIMLEESIKQASKAYVFDANTATTWLTMKNMIANFLNGIWKRGGLAGTSPDDAYEVHVGLGDTMTPEDILEGILRVTVKVALIRPAEFIELTFQQQQQKS